MIEEFRAAQQRQLVKRETVVRKRAEAALQAMACVAPPLPEKVH
jgi:hypothetical protein